MISSRAAKLVSKSNFARTSVEPKTIKPMKHQAVSLLHDEKNPAKVYDRLEMEFFAQRAVLADRAARGVNPSAGGEQQ